MLDILQQMTGTEWRLITRLDYLKAIFHQPIDYKTIILNWPLLVLTRRLKGWHVRLDENVISKPLGVA